MNKSGFSIVEVLIALGIVTSTFMIGTSRIATKNELSAIDQTQSDATLVRGLLEKITSESPLCNLNFRGKSRTSHQFNELKLENDGPPAFVIGQNFKRTNVRIDRLDFTAPDALQLDTVGGKNQYLGQLRAEISWPRADDREETRQKYQVDLSVPVLTDAAGIVDECNVKDHVLTDTLIDDELEDEHANSACDSLGRSVKRGYEHSKPPERRPCSRSREIFSPGPYTVERLGRAYKPESYQGPEELWPYYYTNSVNVGYLELPMRQIASSTQGADIDPRTKLIGFTRDEIYTLKVGNDQANICFEDGKGCPPLQMKYTQCQTVRDGAFRDKVTSVSCPAGKYLINWWREVQDPGCREYRYNANRTRTTLYGCPHEWVQPPAGTGSRATMMGYSYIRRTPTSIELRFQKKSTSDGRYYPFYISNGRHYHGKAAGECCKIEKL